MTGETISFVVSSPMLICTCIVIISMRVTKVFEVNQGIWRDCVMAKLCFYCLLGLINLHPCSLS